MGKIRKSSLNNVDEILKKREKKSLKKKRQYMKQCLSMVEVKMIWKNKKIQRVIVNGVGVKVLASFFFLFLLISLDCSFLR